MSIRLVQCQVFSSGKDGRGKSKGKGKSKDGNGKGKGKKGDKSKDQKQISKPEQFQGHFSGYCEDTSVPTAGKRIADAKSKGGAAAASADDEGRRSRDGGGTMS